MKNLIYILTLLILFGCGNSDKKDNQIASDRMEFIPKPDKDLREKYEKSIIEGSEQIDSIICSGRAVDILKLKEKELQIEFFLKLDSIKKLQYPDKDQDTCNSVDLTPALLNKILKDINGMTLQEKGVFTSFYNFNIACPGFTDSEVCKDKVSIHFFEESCCFRIVIENSYMVEGDCIGGSQVVYGFKIDNGRIIDFGRQEAG